ncbi:MAG: YaeQ family protein [Bdellovibrionaceae bacterium]|nr:YaeQ family protein [Pseudobdellovibrionaceae bacterium]
MLYKFHFDFSDIDRGLYEQLEFRTAQHPSESPAYLLTRALSYALSYRPGLEFSPGGLADPDAPALQCAGAHGAIDLWIEIGNPSNKKMHKASKAAREVVVYTYKNPELLLAQMRTGEIYRAGEIKIYAFDSKFISDLEALLEKNNRWSVLYQQGQLDIDTGHGRAVCEVRIASS